MHTQPRGHPSTTQNAGVCAVQNLTERLAMHDNSHLRLVVRSIIFTQTIETWHVGGTVEIPVPHLVWQDSRRHTSLPIPLRRTLRLPGPVEPSPCGLIGTHLGLGVRHEPRLISVAVRGWVSVSIAAGTGR